MVSVQKAIHHWKLNSATLSSSGVGDDTGSSTIDLTPVGTLTAGSIEYDAFSVNVQDNTTTTDGAVTVTQGKLEGLSLSYPHFDGSADYVTTTTALQTELRTSHSISAWVKFDDGVPAANNAIWGANNSDSTDRSLLYLSTDGKLSYYYESNNNNKLAVENVASFVNGANGWKHITATMSFTDTSNAVMKVFVDGVERALDGGNNGAFVGNMSDYTSSDEIWLGAEDNNNSAQFFMDGGLRDIKFFDYTLSADQVASLYSGSYNVTPLHWWKLDEGTGTTSEDDGPTYQCKREVPSSYAKHNVLIWNTR